MSTIRIGDAERDAAISALGDHYAAGRLTREEYDDRADRATSARFDDDLAPLFADLPAAAAARQVAKPEPASSRQRRRPHPALLAAPLLWFAPLLVIGAIALVAIFLSPWLLFALFWFACAGFGRGPRRQSWHTQRWQGRSGDWPGRTHSRQTAY